MNLLFVAEGPISIDIYQTISTLVRYYQWHVDANYGYVVFNASGEALPNVMSFRTVIGGIMWWLVIQIV